MGHSCFFETFLYGFFVGHIDLTESAADFGGHFLSSFFLQIEQRDLYAMFRKRTRCGFAEPGSAAPYKGGDRRIELHFRLN
jgi:hypothetical protein